MYLVGRSKPTPPTLTKLPDIPRKVLQVASVLGREVPLRLLEAIWQDEAPLGPQLEELQRLEFLYAQAGQEPGFVSSTR
jgi:predicted ATPase